jgi:hypothetical protein
MALGAAWVMTTRVFLMFVGRYGWFATELSQPRFWSLLSEPVITAGLQVSSFGVPANTAISGLLCAAGAVGLIQPRRRLSIIAFGAASGFLVGNVILPHINVFPLGTSVIGAISGIAFSLVVRPNDGWSDRPLEISAHQRSSHVQ